MRIFIFIVLFTLFVFSDNKFSDIKIIFINGIQNTNTEAVKGAKELSYALDSTGRTNIQTIYNHTDGKNGYGFLGDVLETYRLAKYDGTNGGKDFTPFWKAISGRETVITNKKKFQDDYLENIVDNFYISSSDIVDIYTRVNWERGKQENKKLLILSHSEGTVAANLVMKALLEDFSHDQVKECTGLVSIATPVSTSVGIRNNGLYTTSDNDIVIGAIRPDVGSMPSNIHTAFDSKNDIFGHGLVEIYLNRGATPHPRYYDELEYHRPHHETRTQIINQINLMADRINEECQPCADTSLAQTIQKVKSKLENRSNCVGFPGKNRDKIIWVNDNKTCFMYSKYKNSQMMSLGTSYDEQINAGQLVDYFNKEIYHLQSDPEPTGDEYTVPSISSNYRFSKSFNVGFTLVQNKNGNYNQTIRFSNLLTLNWFDGSSHVGVAHYDAYCHGNDSLCNYLKSSVKGNYKDDGYDWLISESQAGNFITNIQNALVSRYSQPSIPDDSKNYPSDWLKRIVDWIENYDCKKLSKTNVFYDETRMQKTNELKGL